MVKVKLQEFLNLSQSTLSKHNYTYNHCNSINRTIEARLISPEHQHFRKFNDAFTLKFNSANYMCAFSSILLDHTTIRRESIHDIGRLHKTILKHIN